MSNSVLDTGRPRFPVDDAIEAALLGPLSSELSSCWSSLIDECISGHVVGLLDLHNGRIKGGWEMLDNPILREKVLFRSTELLRRCVSRLIPLKSKIEAVIATGGHLTRSKAKFEGHLTTVAPNLLQRPSFNAAIARNPFPGSWIAVANVLAAGARSAILADAPTSDPELHNRLLFAAFFWDTRLDRAGLVEHALKDACTSITGVRGSFVRLVEDLVPAGVADTLPRLSSRVNALTLKHAGLSDLLDQTAKESARIKGGCGVVSKIVGPALPVSIPHDVQHLINPAQAQKARPFMYAQYEHTILTYMALSSIEQLARAWAESQGSTRRPTSPRATRRRRPS